MSSGAGGAGGGGEEGEGGGGDHGAIPPLHVSPLTLCWWQLGMTAPVTVTLPPDVCVLGSLDRCLPARNRALSAVAAMAPAAAGKQEGFVTLTDVPLRRRRRRWAEAIREDLV